MKYDFKKFIHYPMKKTPSISKRISIYCVLFSNIVVDIMTAQSIFGYMQYNKGMLSVLVTIAYVFYQISFNVFTKIPSGISAGPVFEIWTATSKLHEKISKANNVAFINFIVTLSIATLIFGVISLFVGLLNLGRFARCAPKTVMIGVLGGIGISLLKTNYYSYIDATFGYYTMMVIYIFSFIVFISQKYVVGFDFFTPSVSIILTILFCGLQRLFFASKTAELQNMNILDTDIDFFHKNLKTFFKEYKNFKAINFKFIFGCYADIANIIFIALIQLPINIVAYSTITTLECSLNKELFTQGISNILGCFVGLPGYFICSFSILFRSKFSPTWFDSYFLSFLCAFSAFLAGFIQKYIPKPIILMYPCLLGCSFVEDCIYKNLGLPLPEFAIIVLTAVVSAFTKTIYGFFVGLALSVVLYYFFKLRFKTKSGNLSVKSLKIDYPLFSFTLLHFSKQTAGLDPVVVDLRDCPAVDCSGNEALLDYLKGNKSCVVLGTPRYLQVDKLENLLVDTEEELMDYLQKSSKIKRSILEDK